MTAGNEYEEWSPSKRKKIKDNFLTFCDIVLAYTQYESSNIKQEELREKNNTSPLDSGVSTADSYTSDAALSSGYPYTDEESTHGNSEITEQLPSRKQMTNKEDDSWDAVTCFCQKPYAGRPMIECSVCLVWLHLTCAKVRRSNIPEVFVCEHCRNTHSKPNAVRSKKRKSSGGVSPGNKFKSTTAPQPRYRQGSPSAGYSRMSPVSSSETSTASFRHSSGSTGSEQYSSSVSPVTQTAYS